MAEKKTQSRAEKAVTETKKKTASGGSSAKPKSAPPTGKAADKKAAKAEKKAKVKTEYDAPIPNSALIAVVSLGMFALLLIIAVNPDGALLKVIQAVLMGLVGQAGFYFAIPAMLYLFMVHTFGRKTNVTMRSICTLSFIFLCGCIYHLTVQTQGMAKGFALIADLYKSGIRGDSGGIFCGGMAMLLRWACGNLMSYIVLILGALLTLLGAVQITIPGIIRAIINRPREDWNDEEEEPEYIEPAAVVVNHITNKQLEYKRQRRERLAAERAMMEAEPPEILLPEPKPAKTSAAPKPAPAPKAPAVPPAVNSISSEEGVPATSFPLASTLISAVPVKFLLDFTVTD